MGNFLNFLTIEVRNIVENLSIVLKYLQWMQ